MTGREAPLRFPDYFESRFLKHYARSKAANDPVYAAALEQLHGSELPLLDVGCGIGMLAFYLRERGFSPSILGIDSDVPKIEAAKRVAVHYSGLEFRAGDAREAFGTFRGSVLLLDLIHYFRDEDQVSLLRGAAESVAPGGVVIIRDCIRDGSWRYRMTMLEEMFARAIRWLSVERLNFPTMETIDGTLTGAGLRRSVFRPLWGRLPFNNHLLVYTRDSK